MENDLKTVAFFNNKGGVGKTTLACNVAAHFVDDFNLRVLIIDGDPQCNSTQLILGEEVCDDLYWSDNHNDRPTLIDVLSPLEEGGATISKDIQPQSGKENRFGVDLLPGHPRMSILEDVFSRAWTEASGGDLGGIRKTNWATALRNLYSDSYDVLFFDLGPSLGSLNRSVLAGCDYFVTPMGADIFSIVGVRNISVWLHDWQQIYNTALPLCESRHQAAFARFETEITKDPSIGFVGYTIQQYIAKTRRGLRRPTAAFEKILKNVPAEIENSLGKFFAEGITTESVKLGDVPNMYSLIPMAQSANSPIHRLSTKDGLVGALYSQRSGYTEVIRSMATALARNIGVAS